MQIQRAIPTAPVNRNAGGPADEPNQREVSQDLVTLGERVTERLRPTVMDQLSPGDKMVFQLLDGRKIVVENPHGGPKATSWFSNVKDFIQAGAQEVSVAVNAGPNLALAGVTEAIKPVVLQGLPDDITSRVDQWYSPAIRGVSIAISLKKFWDRWNHNASVTAAGKPLSTWDKVGVVSDGLHVLTSSAGLIGALGGAIFPSMRGVAAVTMGVAIAGDVGSFAVNGLEYINTRAQVHILPVPEDPQQPEPPPTQKN